MAETDAGRCVAIGANFAIGAFCKHMADKGWMGVLTCLGVSFHQNQ
jgi:hypothetical protein